MPELPEVETIRVGLAPHVEGRRIAAAEIVDGRLTMPELPTTVAERLRGAVVERLDRRGKYLIFRLSGEHVLICHLRMTGNFLWTASGEERPPFTRAELRLDDGSLLRYTDVRRFGTWALLDVEDGAAYIDRRLGPEPLGPWSAAELRRRLDGREAPVKTVLLDQRVVAGVGNIYADEALWRARIHPRTPASRVTGARAAALHEAVRGVLQQGIESQGASIRDYRHPDGSYGSAQERFAVYGRTGEPCEECGTPIERIVVGQRGTHYCPRCQRPPRATRR
jgi:formamidopyrimidine-DNA glycosylase